MDIASPAILLLAGCVAGFLSGVFGIGGGIILVPVLLYYFHATGVSSLVATHLTFGTSLLIILVASLPPAYRSFRDRHVVWSALPINGGAGLLGVLAGTAVAGELQGSSLQVFFALMVVAAAIGLLVESKRAKDAPEQHPPLAALGFVGVVTGLVSPLTGVDGGMFSSRLLQSYAKLPWKKAVGTSSATIVVIAIASTVGYMVIGRGNSLLPSYTWGYVHYLYALPTVAGLLPLTRIGASVGQKRSVGMWRKPFAVVLLVVALKLMFF